MCDMAFGVMPCLMPRSTNRTSIASHLSISVFYDTSFVFGAHRSTYGFTLYLTDCHCLFPRFILSNVLGKYSHKLIHLHTLCILCKKNTLSYLSFIVVALFPLRV